MLWLVISLEIRFDMNLVDCEHPIRVYNKYLGEYVWTSCGKCKACRKRRASRWVARLEVERSQHLFCFFVTLTYRDEDLPILSVDHTRLDMLIDYRHLDVELNVNELSFLTAADRQYFDNRIAAKGGIPYANFSDIQKFHKRLNKYFYAKVSHKWQNFRFFTVSEYGSTVLRPHFHSIYFVDDQQVADNFEKGVRSCWRHGFDYIESVKRSATSYVAQYINELFDLPSFYHHIALRPKFVCSKRPPIGAFAERSEDFKEIFDFELTKRVVNDPKNPATLVDVPVLSCITDRLFPKLKGFRFIPHSLRVALYGLAARQVDAGLPYLRSFQDFLSVCRGHVPSQLNCSLKPLNHAVTMLAEYIACVCHSFTDKGIECLKRLYYISKRVVRNCLEFGVTLEQYVCKIESYWSKRESEANGSFFNFLSRFSGNFENSVYVYPEYCYQVNPRDWTNLSDYSIAPLSFVPQYMSFCQENQIYYERITKGHFKNAYFESIKNRDNSLFNLLKNYYAKKRNEIAQAYG